MSRCLRRLRTLLLAFLAAAASLSPAATLRWAGRGEVGTMDPHSFNEGLTDSVVGHVYEQLGQRARDQSVVPALAESWTLVNDLTWRFTTRRGVKFSDGSAFGAADAVFSIERAQQANSQQAFFARQLGRPVLIDERTFELRLDKPNPLLLEHQLNVRIMSQAWCKANGADKVPNFTNREEGFSIRHAMGTGPFVLESFEAGGRIVMAKNPLWWGRFEGNVDRFVYSTINNDGTRTAALLSGDIDFTHDTPPQDVTRLARETAVKLATGAENRLIFFGMDQFRDELLYSNVKGRNPFKDARVREAFALAIDADAIKTGTMRGQSAPTDCLSTAAIGCLAPELDKRPAADAARARKLLADAGYAEGFEIALDCPNDRYVNDQAICIAVAGMLGRVGIKARVDARPKTLFFQKLERFDTSFYLLGWGGGTTDAQTLLDPIVHIPEPRTKKGEYNYGRGGDADLDRIIDAAGSEMNTDKRKRLIAEAQRRGAQLFLILPLHRQMLTWAARSNVTPVVMPDNAVRVQWFRID